MIDSLIFVLYGMFSYYVGYMVGEYITKKNMGDYKDRPFNMAQLLLERLDKRLDELDRASIEGEYLMWYKIARSISNNIYPFLKTSEEKEAIEKKLTSLGRQ